MYDTKKCSCCQLIKETTEFNFKSKKKNTFHSSCKKCQAEYHKKHYLANKQAYAKKRRVNNRKYRTKGREFIYEYKKTYGCYFCKENEPCCLDFHHKNPKNKTANISKMKGQAKAIPAIKKEIKKCIVICSNCHRKLHTGLLTIR